MPTWDPAAFRPTRSSKVINTIQIARRMPKLCVVIPTFKHHLSVLRETLDSVAAQTRLPDLVIVRASSCDAETAPTLAELRATLWPFPLEILETSALQFTGQNKNEGAAAVPSSMDIISFFDSDDIMHPRRLEFVERSIVDDGADVVCHNSTYCYSREAPLKWDMLLDPRLIWDSYVKTETILSPYNGKQLKTGRVIFLDDEDEEIGYHDGSLTIRRECFSKVQFDPEAKGYQDCKFFSDLLRARYKVLNICIPLMIYMGVSQEEQFKKNSAHLPGPGPSLVPYP